MGFFPPSGGSGITDLAVTVITTNWVRTLLSQPCVIFHFLDHIKHTHPTQQTSGHVLKTARDAKPCSASTLAHHCILHHFQYLASLEMEGEGKGQPPEEHSVSPVDYLIAAKAIQ